MRTLHASWFILYSILTICVLVACTANPESATETGLPSPETITPERVPTQRPATATIEPTATSTSTTEPTAATQATIGATPTPLPTLEERYFLMAPEEVIVAYYAFLTNQQYAQAYQLLTQLDRPSYRTAERYISNASGIPTKYEILSLQRYEDWRATAATTPGMHLGWSDDVDDICQRYMIDVYMDFEGGWGAGPSGTYTHMVTMVKEEGSWKIRGVGYPDTTSCSKYRPTKEGN
ncbi:MAG: DUF4829 domain-containing protein [Anaerolineaceae bacterium]